ECRTAMTPIDARLADPKAESEVFVDVQIRSTEGIVYYLGELMREQVRHIQEQPKSGLEDWNKAKGPGFVDYEDHPGLAAVLFRARPGSPFERNTLLSINHRGTTYLIPASRTGGDLTIDRDGSQILDYSSGTLNFVDLLFGLNK